MVWNISKVAECVKDPSQGLSERERNIFAAGFKNVVGYRRNAWRIISSIERKEREQGNERRRTLAEQYRAKVEGDVREVCAHMLEILDANLLPVAHSGENIVFFLKMKGDYLRYLAEVTVDEERAQLTEKAREIYDQAMEEASDANIAADDPIQLGLVLNFSVFFYEIANEPLRACQLARDAIADAEDVHPESTDSDANLIIQLLKDNIDLWDE